MEPNDGLAITGKPEQFFQYPDGTIVDLGMISGVTFTRKNFKSDMFEFEIFLTHDRFIYSNYVEDDVKIKRNDFVSAWMKWKKYLNMTLSEKVTTELLGYDNN